ncbi:MAG: glycoside hydrolase family 3 C-terminal domain-containing protein [Terriglobales bacterium]
MLVSISSRAQTSKPENPAYLNPALSLDQRVDDLVGRMTLQEKASQVVHNARTIDRLGIPAYNWWSEGLHGVGLAGVATVFPQAIGLAATWDPKLLHQVATVIGIEARAKHHESVRQGRHDLFYGLTFWSPNINIFRDPRWGRGQETYGEDPFLTARLGVAFVTGLQGDDPRYLRVVATPKHFAVHSGPEPLRHAFDVGISRHDMAETYLPAFRATLTEGKAGSVMCAYNSINGQPACVNDFLLRDRLRGDWHFNGYVVSDCGAIANVWDGHHYVKSPEQAAALAIKTGMDLECAFPDSQADPNYAKYVRAVQEGLLPEAELTNAVKGLYRARFQLGMFDPPEMVAYARTPFSENDSEAHRALSLQSARESMVLLKNNGILPLSQQFKRIAIVGPLANSVDALLGNYNGVPSRATTAIAGITHQFANAQVSYERGDALIRQAMPVPEEVLPGGLKAEFFKGNTKLQGQPAFTRTDRNIDDSFWLEPTPGFGHENFSVRWTGELVPDSSGAYQLGFTGDDGFRVFLDDKPVVEDWSVHPARTAMVAVPLERGHRYRLRVEYFQAHDDATAKLIWIPPNTVENAVQAARNSDVVIAVVGIMAALEGEEMDIDVPGFKGGDRTSLDLPENEEELLKALKATGKPLVVVLMNGSALSINWAQEHADAILESWYAGEEGGAAIAETLAGVNNPAGRLPVTFYKSVDQLPLFEDYSMKNRTYRYFTGEPLYPFGYGLSYSRFEYGPVKVELKAPGGPVQVAATVKNVSQRDGDEVAELYVSNSHSRYVVPLRTLAGFEHIRLKAGESRELTFTLQPDQLAAIDENGNSVFDPGEFTVSVGGGQPSSALLESKQAAWTTFTLSK